MSRKECTEVLTSEGEREKRERGRERERVRERADGTWQNGGEDFLEGMCTIWICHLAIPTC